MSGFVAASLLCVAWITVSYLLIAFNKYLMTDGGFPFAAALGLIHGLTCSGLAALLLLVKPSLFPSLMDSEKRVALDRNLYLKALLPICICFTIEIILGNQAYKYLSLAFLQMLKESNVVLVYAMGIAASMERFNWTNLKLIVCILLASLGTIQGELNFTWEGFSIQMLCCVAGSLKITLQGVLLTSAGMKFDALSYILMVMPICAMIQGIALFISQSTQDGGAAWMPVPTWSDVISHWHLLVPNALLAFTLNVVAVLFIKASSSVAYVLAGIVKDMVIVIGGVFLGGDTVSSMQTLAFSAQIFFLLILSMAKQAPGRFEDGVLNGIRSGMGTLRGVGDGSSPSGPLKESPSANCNYGSSGLPVAKFLPADASSKNRV